MVGRVVVGARYGLRDWVAQRATAALMAALMAVFFVGLMIRRPDSHAAWAEIFSAGWVRVGAFMLVFLLAWHAFIGARDIFMDYIKNDLFRLLKHIGALVYLAACVIWAADILLI